jgi:hypothetical protein
MKKFLTFVSLGVLSAAPLLALAATAPVPGGISTAVLLPYSNGIINVINKILVPLLIGIAFITFLWGLYKHFILGASEESEKAEGRKFAMWGIIGFVVILSVWGLVNLVVSAVNLPSDTTPAPPTFNTGAAATH